VESIAYAHHRNHGNELSLEDQLDIVQFVQLLACLLNFDPRHRATPTQAIQHPFVTMQHLAMHTNSFK
jgi:serine/threonine protein kinase